MPIPAGSTPPPAPTSGPLVYDPVLSRVRLSLPLPEVSDAFSRTVTDDWGTAPSGHVWTKTGGAASDYRTTGSVGRHTHTSTNVLHHSFTNVQTTDAAVRADVTLAIASASGAPVTMWLAARVFDTSNYYAAELVLGPGTGMQLFLVKRVGGSLSPVLASASVGAHTAGATWSVRFEVVGSALRAKAWLASGSEPASWQVSVVDTDLAVGTLAGLLSRFEGGNSNTLPQSVDWDNVSITPVATVQRSTDGVRWTTVRGGADLTPTGGTLRLDDYEFTPDVPNTYRAASYSGTITPLLGGVWLKSVARPYLNQQVTVRDYSDVSRAARGGVFDVVGRSFPVAVTDVRGSRRWTLDVSTYSPEDAADLDLLLAGGDILLVHVPTVGRLSAVPGGYVTVGDTREVTPPTADLRMRVFEVPCAEVAAPGPDVIGAAVTCQTVLNTYGTCQQVLSAHPTVLDLLELVGDPTDVLVP